MTVDAAGRLSVALVPAAAAAETVSELAGQVVSVAPTGTVTTMSGPDPYEGDQWAVPKLSLATSWGLSTGAGVDIAVIDSGVDATHEDLAGKVTSGPSFLGGTETAGGGGTASTDHGTHVAGIAAAVTGNGIGVAGVAPDANIIAVKVLNSEGVGYTSDIASGIIWAVDNGAEVVNLSLGSSANSPTMANAVQYAVDEGAIVVAAAGNSGACGTASYPAANNVAVAVASSNESDELSSFSTTGTYVDIAAPGEGIVSTTPGNDYLWMSGTSMATPQVAGIAALLLSAGKVTDQATFADLIAATALDVGPAGVDEGFGAGIISPYDALVAAP